MKKLHNYTTGRTLTQNPVATSTMPTQMKNKIKNTLGVSTEDDQVEEVSHHLVIIPTSWGSK